MTWPSVGSLRHAGRPSKPADLLVIGDGGSTFVGCTDPAPTTVR
jgi:hypothetical protein